MAVLFLCIDIVCGVFYDLPKTVEREKSPNFLVIKKQGRQPVTLYPIIQNENFV